MSSRFASEQLTNLRHDAQRLVEEAEDQEDHALALVAIEDVNVASRSPARLLITASTPQAVETLARRIHGIGPRAQLPFVVTCAGELPIGAQALRDAAPLVRHASARLSLQSLVAPLERARLPDDRLLRPRLRRSDSTQEHDGPTGSRRCFRGLEAPLRRSEGRK